MKKRYSFTKAGNVFIYCGGEVITSLPPHIFFEGKVPPPLPADVKVDREISELVDRILTEC